ncbi:ABC transporter related protein (plasmid) [Streptantibioticus cattleyicolor NRRL 8057 = DSM 46488]|uniref:ABC transporter related protein n=1 Tax=Streptantibioticus cattleyicolor (strain ATCC 35852 / DSM 46488 / JCM 4925 / NBRC 14057 / NRRL 8057) TaxID=1003195 RepID=G8XGI6_STREN|nr:ABC transporter related protein [Streptantibioticus cattleyicolor NRRL 8057 = DSM 46488]
MVKCYGRIRALDGFDLEVGAGEVTGLIGHNGAGKTTFVEVVTQLVRPDAGELRICGSDALRGPRSVREMVGVCPQEISLYRTATVRDNLRLFGALAGLRRAARHEAIRRLATELMLESVLDRPVGLISGGQQRRAQAASAMIGNPPLLLLDEPTAGADPQTRAALLRSVRARAEAGAAVVYTTHYLPELTDLAATLAVVRRGRVVARGEQSSLLHGLPSTVRLRFDTSRPARLPPELARRAVRENDEWHLTSLDPPADLAALVAAGCSPTFVDVDRPGLDHLFEALGAPPAGNHQEEARDAG